MIDPTPEQIEAEVLERFPELDPTHASLTYPAEAMRSHNRSAFESGARWAALVAAAGAAPQEPTETKTSQDFISAAVQVDEAKLAEAIGHALDDWQGEELPEVFVARAVAEWLRGGGQ